MANPYRKRREEEDEEDSRKNDEEEGVVVAERGRLSIRIALGGRGEDFEDKAMGVHRCREGRERQNVVDKMYLKLRRKNNKCRWLDNNN